MSACSFDFFIIDFRLQPKPPIANRAQARPPTIWKTRLMVSISVPLKCTARTKTIIAVDWDLPFTLHRNSPAHLKSHNIKISLRLQQFSGRPSDGWQPQAAVPWGLLTVLEDGLIPVMQSARFRAYPNNRVVMRPSEKFEAKAAGQKGSPGVLFSTLRTFFHRQRRHRASLGDRADYWDRLLVLLYSYSNMISAHYRRTG